MISLRDAFRRLLGRRARGSRVSVFGGLAVIACAVLLVFPVAAGQRLDVQTREAPLRANPGPFARVLETLSYGQSVEVLEKRSGWMRVRVKASGAEGWAHASSLTEREVALEAGSGEGAGGASDEEVALAGKGFNERVEKNYKEKNEVDYTWVDRMEKFKVSDSARKRFLAKGNLAQGGEQ